MYIRKIALLKRVAKMQNILLLALLWSLMHFFILPDATKHATINATQSTLLDQQYFSKPSEMYQSINGYGPVGRKLYVVIELTADIFYALIQAFLLSLLIMWSQNRKYLRKYGYLALIPFLAMFANWAENICIIFLLLYFPKNLIGLAHLTSLLIILKGILNLLSLVTIGWNVAKLILQSKQKSISF